MITYNSKLTVDDMVRRLLGRQQRLHSIIGSAADTRPSYLLDGIYGRGTYFRSRFSFASNSILVTYLSCNILSISSHITQKAASLQVVSRITHFKASVIHKLYLIVFIVVRCDIDCAWCSFT